jgi:hypothetical protein
MLLDLPPNLANQMQMRPRYMQSPTCQIVILASVSDEFCFAIVMRLKCKPMPPQASTSLLSRTLACVTDPRLVS